MTHAAQIPVLRWPFRFVAGNGEFDVVEQDSIEDVMQSVRVLIKTGIGDRVDLPTYGITDPIFSTGDIRGEILTRMAQWEPRATALLEADYDRIDVLIRSLNIRLEERST